jgi:hypothetical protein
MLTSAILSVTYLITPSALPSTIQYIRHCQRYALHGGESSSNNKERYLLDLIIAGKVCMPAVLP